MDFAKNVFINCPFDADYQKYLRPLIFTICFLELEPRLSETKDSGAIRVNEILKLIKNSKYSIHDLSRAQSTKIGEYARFNMPFELGLDLGVREAGKNLSEKKCLILDSKKYRYQATLSDIAGSDISYYDNKVEELVNGVRNWFARNLPPPLTSGSKIWQAYNEFAFDFEIKLLDLGFKKNEIETMNFSEYIYYVKEWISGK